MDKLTALPPLSLYIHFPWCIQKCPYCDFNSHEIKKGIPEEEYINALLKDLENDLPLVWGRKITTIFMGGGTPSLFSPEAMDTLLSGIRARIPVSPNAEITIEANPGTVENEYISGFKEAGINRISFGVQSFNDDILKKLGRIHNAESARQAIKKAKSAGFDRINIDLMFALPGQSLAQAKFDLESAITLSPTHISYYQLTIEPNTAFYHNPPTVPNDDASWEIFQQGKSILKDAGFDQYEVSAYATNGDQCRHNTNYWLFGDYLGIGAGAHAKITDGAQQSITRYWKHKHPKEYLSSVKKTALAGQQKLTDKELLFEFLMNGLRLNNGFAVELFCNRTGLTDDALNKQLHSMVNEDLIEWNKSHNTIAATEKGKMFLNNILERCLPD
ncbi:MAG: radical SAM family heme chaperone HemW [Gammaproteobacteria bacterium]|nr:radical SAM family heme chaperone HemW [Gammaproteobacteria bacterium]